MAQDNFVQCAIDLTGKTIMELADELDVCRTTLIYWRKTNKIPLDRVKPWCDLTGQDPREVRPDAWEIFKDLAA